MANVKISGIANQESTSVTDTDLFEGEEAGGTSFKVAFSVMKSTIKTYTDTLYQALDATLTALAGLASAANKIPYFTGSDTASMLDFKDEDDMASNSATALPSQQSVKAYVDVTAGAGTFKNLIINGDMQISQRGTSEASVTTGGYKKAPDRWQFNIANLGTWTLSQSTTAPTGYGYSYKALCTTADAAPAAADNCYIAQKIEGQFLQYLKKGTASAESLTLSFKVRSNKTGTYIAMLYDSDNVRAVSASYTINAANTWEDKTITFPGDTTGTLNNDNGDSIWLLFWFAAGSNYTSAALQTSWGGGGTSGWATGQTNLADTINNEWYVTAVQLEAGASATSFERLPWDAQLQRCQRYYYKTYNHGTVPGAVTEAGSIQFQSTGSGWDLARVCFPTTMRTAGTGTVYSTSTGTASKIYDAMLAADQNGLAAAAGESGITCGLNNVIVAVAHILKCHVVVDAEL